MATNARLNTILAKASRMDQVKIPKDFIGMVYALPGAGKTTMVAELAQALREYDEDEILYIDSSDGWVTLEGQDELTDGVWYSGSYVPAAELTAYAEGLALHKRTGKGDWANVRTVILDEFSSWYKEVLEDAARSRVGGKADDNLPELLGTDHGTAQGVMEAVLARFHKIPNLHIIVVAHAREKVQKNGSIERTSYAPNFGPLMNINLQQKMHCTAFIGTKFGGKGDLQRTVQAQPSALVAAKSRIRNMPATLAPSEWVDRVVDWIGSDHYAGERSDDPVTTDIDDTEVEETEELPVDDEEQA